MKKLSIKDIEEKGYILYKTLSGSRAYGTNKETSDFDYRGVYILPIEYLLGNNYIPQISDNTNDETYYEIGRFLQLLQTQNPNIVELFNMPEECILYKDPIFDDILKYQSKFISKVCNDSFGGYAVAQIKKARGLNKKIVNPLPKERKGLLDFCWVGHGQGSISLKEFLSNNGIDPKTCGCVAIEHMKNTYHLFLVYDDSNKKYKGITDVDDVQIVLSSVDKNEIPFVTFYCNIEGFQKYCKEYSEYWDWVEKRNDDRYQTNQEHGKGYDSKNMMHCIRLLRMAVEIARDKKVNVRRADAVELLTIRNGDAEYDDLLKEANETIDKLDEIFENSDLPDSIDQEMVNDILINFRKKYYKI